MPTRSQTTVTLPFTEFLPALDTFVFRPLTNWQNFLRGWFHTDVNFGSFGYNVEDESVENHVVNKAGSYGKQLNSIIDLLSLYTARLDRDKLTRQEQIIVDKFDVLAQVADKAATEFQGKTSQGLTRSDVNELIDKMLSLKGSSGPLYDDFWNLMERRLGPRKP